MELQKSRHAGQGSFRKPNDAGAGPGHFERRSCIGHAAGRIGSAHENRSKSAQQRAGDDLARKLLLRDKRNFAGTDRRQHRPIEIARMIGHDDRISLRQRRVGLNIQRDARKAKKSRAPAVLTRCRHARFGAATRKAKPKR